MLSLIIRKLIESLSIFHKNDMNISTIKDEKIQSFIEKKAAKIKVKDNSLKLTHQIFNFEIYKIISKKKFKNFLRNSSIQKMFFVHNRLFVLKELNCLKNDKNWNFYKKIITEDSVGNPVRYFLYPKSSGNRINHVYHLSVLINSLDIDIKKIKNVYEFGGGYGCMARIFSKINKKIKYTIFDTGLVNLIQYYYLKQNNLDVGFDKENQYFLTNNFKEKTREKLNKSLFIANWSMSETPLKIRKNIIKEMKRHDYVIISFQEYFENINNLVYFKNFQYSLNTKYNFTLLPNNFYKGNIFNKQRHFFLIGKKSQI